MSSSHTATQIRSFAIVGSVGFALEAIILTGLTQYAGWSPWKARVPSFCTAVLTTWMLNRRHTFRGRGLHHRSLEAALYVLIQLAGAGVNLGIFGASFALWPRLATVPVIPLGVGAAGGFVFNFAVSRLVLYSRQQISDERDRNAAE